MQVEHVEIVGVLVFSPKRFFDQRGFFSETYNRRALADAGIEVEFVQDNHSLSGQQGTVRGLHFQIPPAAQAKLVRVARGAILDVAVDIRSGSPTFGHNVSLTLSAGDWNQIFIPPGFAHGYCTLEPDTEVLYKVSDYYSPEHERGLLWNDPDLGIDWPVSAESAVVTERDSSYPRLRDLPGYFSYEPTVNI